MIELAAFLGNPGKEYSRNRHNAGFLLAERIKIIDQLSWQKKFKGLYAALGEGQARLHLIKPLSYMNLSGESVSAAATFFKIKNDSILVIHDELELALGTISLKFGGGLGGHNGLRSLKRSLGSADFWRLRLGIGRPDSRLPGEGGPEGSGEGIADWVLSDFSPEEAEAMDRVLGAAEELFLGILSDGPEGLLKEWAKKKIL